MRSTRRSFLLRPRTRKSEWFRWICDAVDGTRLRCEIEANARLPLRLRWAEGSRIKRDYVAPERRAAQSGEPGSRRRWGRSRHTVGTGRAVFTPPYGA